MPAYAARKSAGECEEPIASSESGRSVGEQIFEGESHELPRPGSRQRAGKAPIPTLNPAVNWVARPSRAVLKIPQRDIDGSEGVSLSPGTHAIDPERSRSR